MEIFKNNNISNLRPVINKSFLIRVTFFGRKQTYLYGVSTYVDLVGSKIAYKHFLDALNSPLDVYTTKLRKFIKTEFVSK